MAKEKRYRVEMTESQLRLMANCVEDLHRFMGGQMELSNTASCLENYCELRDRLEELKPIVTPHLAFNAFYGWNGGHCPNKWQRKFMAQSYYLYREIYHKLTVERAKTEDIGYNVYLSPTLTCEDSGEPIKVEVIE